mgnify:CR=1 FL=1
MSDIKDRLTAAMKDAMRAKDSARLGVIRMALAAFKQIEVDERIEVSDERALVLLDKLVKMRQEAARQFADAHRQDLADKEKSEMAVLQGYLPQRMSAEETAVAVQAIVIELGAKGQGDMGKVMGVVKTRLAGKADMGQVSAAVKAALSS